ncbi:PadR family transcriptional regulator [Reyranella sp.]|uniref:PadR family transcriptional regulator n=1 Tax=Reyranella sp. TaxID=1929291 RepID=UPI0025CCA5D1|nr:PadR family transcriptional regulator [Reyranella sp.]
MRHDDHRGRHGGHRHHGHGSRHGFRRHGWGGDEEGRGGRRRRVFDSGELRLVLLKLIADEPRHGYELIRAIEELSGGVYAPSPGVVYPTLTMLHEMAQIEETESGGARKAFSVTAEGTAHLAAHKADVEALLARLAELSSARQRTDGGPLRRAMQNLRTVLVYRFDRDDVAADTVHQAAAILDEASQRIEKL